ncbi:MAG: hypothetical protein ABSD72_05185 [Terracidiphilus sp.]
MSSQQPIPNYSSEDHGWVESRQHFAHNQTRKSFLSWNVVAGDFSFPSLTNRMLKLTPNSGSGLWIRPFKGFPFINESMPLDLVYLDSSHRVIDLVRSFSLSHPSHSSQPAASVLALPSAVISSSDTHRGDLLIICAADEFMSLQGRDAGASSLTLDIAGADRNSDRPGGRVLRFPEFEQAQLNDPSEEAEHFITPALIESTQVKESGNISLPLGSRLARLLYPGRLNRRAELDRRKAARNSVGNLVASFWTGGAPTVDVIRDVSSTGLYVVTAERWYLGTVIRMTLTKADPMRSGAKMSICVGAEAIRWGNDGVGLRFVVESTRRKNRGQLQPLDGADRKQLDQFLEGIAT